MQNEDIESTLVLSDGRKLTYQEYGDLVGYPILLFHGTPGSRLWFMEDDPIALELGIRLITLDLPCSTWCDFILLRLAVVILLLL